MRSLWMAVKLIVSLAVLTFVAIQVGNFEVRRLAAKVDQLEQERAEMHRFIERLGAERRVAQIDVLSQRDDADGATITELRWQEIGADGTVGRPATVEIRGTQVYVEGLVIKFAQRHVGEGDPQRGQSLVMFRRLFGDAQAPEAGVVVKPEWRAPTPTESDNSLQVRLWDQFWDLVDSPALAAQFGVRVAQCEAPAVRVRPGQTWEVAIDAAGGLNLRKIGDGAEPVAVRSSPA